jgi:uncharacterized protein YbjT (DUF2867 family)
MATYLVTQATGSQSQWVITYLLAAGAKVHAVVRNPDKDLPAVLKKPGVTIFKGDSTDFDSIFKAAQGCKGVFLNTFPIPGIEEKQAQTIAAASKKAGVESVVAATTFATGDKSKWDTDVVKEGPIHAYYSSKAAVEAVVREAGFKAYTILRPGFIAFNYFNPHVQGNYPLLPTTGVIYHGYEDSARMPQTDGADIGSVGAAALLDPAKYNGHEIELLSENPTIAEVRDIINRVSGKNIKLHKWTPEEIEEQKKTPIFIYWFNHLCNNNDFDDLVQRGRESQAKLGFSITSLEDALTRDKAELLASLPA